MSIKTSLEKAMNVVGANAGMLNSRVITLTPAGEISGEHRVTAPADGWFAIRVQNKTDSSATIMFDVYGLSGIGGQVHYVQSIIPVSKGSTLVFAVNDSATYLNVFFYYANGCA